MKAKSKTLDRANALHRFFRFTPQAYPRLLLPFALCLLPLAFSLRPSAADQVIAHQPASEGRPITPAGALLLDATTRQPAVGALTLDFVRSPDAKGPQGGGRFLLAVNSGYGLRFNAATNKAQQSLAVIDLNAQPAPAVVQNIYFPTPQSVNVGVVFAPRADADGAYTLYVSGGVENKIWQFRFRPDGRPPVTPTSPGPDTKVTAPFLDVSGFSPVLASQRYNAKNVPVYPTGLDISADGSTLFVANNLDDSLGLIRDLYSTPRLARIPLPGRMAAERNAAPDSDHLVYPYGVVALSAPQTGDGARPAAAKVYVSCWNDASVAVVDFAATPPRVSYVPVARHPTKMLHDAARQLLYVVNSNADSVSVIDTRRDVEVERIGVRLSEDVPIGHSPESLALSADGRTLYVANAHSNAVAVVALAEHLAARTSGGVKTEGEASLDADEEEERGPRERSARFEPELDERSRVRGFIPTGQYPSAVALVGSTLFVGNGKGTGFANSSLVVDNSGHVPNLPNDRFPTGTGRAGGMGGAYSPALVAGNISLIPEPDAAQLARYTQQVMRNAGLLDAPKTRLFAGRSPFKHVVYVIKENRTYDQVFGDLERAGDGTPADGDPALAIFGASAAARRPGGPAQNITPNQRALALRFGLLDRFFTNAEASADGHNWSTAAFSNDYTDKAYRWNYSDRGRSYDFEGFNRLPNYRPAADLPPLTTSPNYRPPPAAPPVLPTPATAADFANFMRRFVPYLHGARDVAEPETLYLWDAVARAGLTYRNYGEFVGTESEQFIRAVNVNKARKYPDVSPTAFAIPTKRALEGHHSQTFRNFDMLTPDAMTPDSYRAARESGGAIEPLIHDAHADARFRGNSRMGEWLKEFDGFVADLAAGRGDRLPALSIVRLPNDHTEGVNANYPTAQFYVAENDYATGRLVEAISNSPYWRDTAIVIVEDDAQDGPDHVDAHRSLAFVISAYNRPGALVHTFHNTVSLIRTIELLLGLPPMNQLDATAAPVDIFRATPDLRPFKAVLPDVALDNLMTVSATSEAEAYWMRRTAEQNLSHADQADAHVLNQAIWFSVRGADCPMPQVVSLPAFEAMNGGRLAQDDDDAAERAPRRDSARARRPRRAADDED
jgi:DNA-binding beta-propeller fold protein YncE